MTAVEQAARQEILDFSTLKKNIQQVSKFKVGDKPDLFCKQIKKDERVILQGIRRWFWKAFDPKTLKETCEAAAYILEKERAASECKNEEWKKEADLIAGLARPFLCGCINIWETYYKQDSRFAEPLAIMINEYTPILMDPKKPFYRTVLERFKYMWSCYNEHHNQLADSLAETYNSYENGFLPKLSEENRARKFPIRRNVSYTVVKVQKERTPLKSRLAKFKSLMQKVKNEKNHIQNELDKSLNTIRKKFSQLNSEEAVKEFDKQLEEKRSLMRSASETQIFYENKVLMVVRDKFEKPPASPAPPEPDWEEILPDPVPFQRTDDLNDMFVKSIYKPMPELKGYKPPVQRCQSEVFQLKYLEEARKAVKESLLLRRSRVAYESGSSGSELDKWA